MRDSTTGVDIPERESTGLPLFICADERRHCHVSERVLALAGTPATEEEEKEVMYVNTLQIQVQIKVYNNNCTAIPCDAVHWRLEPNI